MSDQPLVKPGEKLQDVPEFLKQFVLCIAKTFYGLDHFVIADYVQRNVCVKEEKLRTLLKFDPRSLKPILTELKVDKLIKERIVAEEVDGRQKKFTYYYINYKGVINVTKYKLDQIRHKLESREKDQVNRTIYKCVGCGQTYDQMDIGTIFQPDTNTMQCNYCFNEVKDDEEDSGPTEGTRSSLAKFNEQTGPLVSVMQQMNGVIFAEHILEPPVPTSAKDEGDAKKDDAPKKIYNLGERSFNANGPNFTADTIKLNLGGEVDNFEPEKEAVPWLDGSVRISLADKERREAAKKSREIKKSTAKLNKWNSNDLESAEIEQLLEQEKQLMQNSKKENLSLAEFLASEKAEKPDGSPPAAKRPKFMLGADDDDDSRSTMLPKGRSYREDLQRRLMVPFQGSYYPITAVTDDMMAKMDEHELNQLCEARERLIDLVFRYGW